MHNFNLIKTNKLNEKISFQPKVVTATDEADLARRMERAEAENAEIDGDDEEEDEDGLKYDGDEGDEKDEDAAGSAAEDDVKIGEK